jgi:hypothetical protein
MVTAKTPIRKRVLSTKSLGKRWGKAVQDMVTKEAMIQAKAILKRGELSTDEEEVEVLIPVVLHLIPVVLHLSFARRGKLLAGDAGVRCACTYKEDSTGSTCTCTGPGAANCDCGMIVA